MKPVNTAVVDTAKVINVLNKIMETELSVSTRPIIAIKNPMDDIAHVVHELDKEIRKLEHEMKKLEHLMHIDKIKAEMRHVIEKALHRIEHDIERAIHKLEPHIKVKGLNMSGVDLAFSKFRTGLNFKDINFGLGTYGIAIKGISLGLHGLQSCK